MKDYSGSNTVGSIIISFFKWCQYINGIVNLQHGLKPWFKNKYNTRENICTTQKSEVAEFCIQGERFKETEELKYLNVLLNGKWYGKGYH